MRHGVNRPLTRAQVKALPAIKQRFIVNRNGHLQLVTDFNGFTPTSVGITGQELKRAGRNKPYDHTNRKSGRGRVQQIIPIFKKDADGNNVLDIKGRKVLVSHKTIWHRDARRIMNV